MQGARLGCGWRIGQLIENLLFQVAVTKGLTAFGATQIGPCKGKSHLMGHKFIIGQALARWTLGRNVVHRFGMMRRAQSRGPVWPTVFGFLAGINPFRQIGDFAQECRAGLGHGFLGDTRS